MKKSIVVLLAVLATACTPALPLATPPPPPPTSYPTYMPYPTHTPLPRPSSTPTTSVSSEEASYVSRVRAILQEYANCAGSLEMLSDELVNNPQLLLDEGWRTRNAVALATMKNIGQRIRTIEAPPRFQYAHTALIEASHHFDRAADLQAEGIDHLDPSKLQAAIIETKLANLALGQALGRAQEVVKER